MAVPKMALRAWSPACVAATLVVLVVVASMTPTALAGNKVSDPGRELMSEVVKRQLHQVDNCSVNGHKLPMDCVCSYAKDSTCAYNSNTSECRKDKGSKGPEWMSLQTLVGREQARLGQTPLTSADVSAVVRANCAEHMRDLVLPVLRSEGPDSAFVTARHEVETFLATCGSRKETSRHGAGETRPMGTLVGTMADVHAFMGLAIEQAKHSVQIKTMRWQDGNSADTLAAALRKAAGLRRDAAPQNEAHRPFEVTICRDVHRLAGGGGPLDPATLGGAEGARVKVVDRKTWLFGTGHSKMVIIDHRYVVITSSNVQDRGNTEVAVLLSGSAVAEYMSAFDSDCLGGPPDRNALVARKAELENPTMDNEDLHNLALSWPTVPGVPSFGSRSSRVFRTDGRPSQALVTRRSATDTTSKAFLSNTQNVAFASLIRAAKHSIFIVTPNLNAGPIVALLNAAIARGVKVEVTLTYGFNDDRERLPGQGGANHDVLDAMWDQYQAGVQRDKGLFVPCWYQARHPEGPEHSHVKLMVIDDDVSVVGSSNLDTQSIFHSEEVNTVLSSRAYAASMRALWRDLTLSDTLCYPAAKRPNSVSLANVMSDRDPRKPSLADMCSGKYPAKIAVFPGSYSPFHTGHLLTALNAGLSAGLDCVWLIPAYDKSFEKGHVRPEYYHHRYAMVARTLADYRQLRVVDLPQITSKPLALLVPRYRKVGFWALFGDDIAHEYATSALRRSYVNGLLSACQGVVINRRYVAAGPGSPAPQVAANSRSLVVDERTDAENPGVFALKTAAEGMGLQVAFATEPGLGISSSLVRKALAVSEAATLPYLPAAVAKYLFSPEGIEMRDVYLANLAGSKAAFAKNLVRNAMASSKGFDLNPPPLDTPPTFEATPGSQVKVGVVTANYDSASEVNKWFLRIVAARERADLDLVFVCGEPGPGAADESRLLLAPLLSLRYVVLDERLCLEVETLRQRLGPGGMKTHFLVSEATLLMDPNVLTGDSSQLTWMVFVDWTMARSNADSGRDVTVLKGAAGELTNTAPWTILHEALHLGPDSPLPSSVIVMSNPVQLDARSDPPSCAPVRPFRPRVEALRVAPDRDELPPRVLADTDDAWASEDSFPASDEFEDSAEDHMDFSSPDFTDYYSSSDSRT